MLVFEFAVDFLDEVFEAIAFSRHEIFVVENLGLALSPWY